MIKTQQMILRPKSWSSLLESCEIAGQREELYKIKGQTDSLEATVHERRMPRVGLGIVDKSRSCEQHFN